MGTPVISVEGVAFFGPVVTPVPKGEAAGVLWDGVLAVAGTDGFFVAYPGAGFQLIGPGRSARIARRREPPHRWVL